MLAKKITYTDFDGVERTETVRFNLSKSELVDMQLSKEGGLDVMLQEIVDSKNQQEIMKLFKKIILKAYGEKSEDGRYFRKSEELSEAFSQSAAYDALYLDLLSDPTKAADFIRDTISAPELKEAVERARIESGIPSSEPVTLHVTSTNKYAND